MKTDFGVYTFAVAVAVLGLEIYRSLQPIDCSLCDIRNGSQVDLNKKTPTWSSSGKVDLMAELDLIRVRAAEHKRKLIEANRMPKETPVSLLVAEAAVKFREADRQEAELKKNPVSAPKQQVNPPPSSGSHYRPPPSPSQTVSASSKPSGIGQPGMGSMPKSSPSFISLLEKSYPGGVGVLLGVGNGRVASDILAEWRNSPGLYLVDPFIKTWPFDASSPSDKDLQLQFEQVNSNLTKKFPGRFAFVRDFSYSFAATYRAQKGDPPALVFWDNNSKGFKRDFDDWWPLLAKGGLFAGVHYPLIKQQLHDLTINLKVQVGNNGDEWYLVKLA